jgi:hypothetical protein
LEVWNLEGRWHVICLLCSLCPPPTTTHASNTWGFSTAQLIPLFTTLFQYIHEMLVTGQLLWGGTGMFMHCGMIQLQAMTMLTTYFQQNHSNQLLLQQLLKPVSSSIISHPHNKLCDMYWNSYRSTVGYYDCRLCTYCSTYLRVSLKLKNVQSNSLFIQTFQNTIKFTCPFLSLKGIFPQK